MRVSLYNAYDSHDILGSYKMDAPPCKDDFVKVGSNTYLVLSVTHEIHVTDEGWQCDDTEIRVRCQKVDLP